MCQKYSIIPSSRSCKKKSFYMDENEENEGMGIDIDGITRRYVKSRSKEKQRDENRQKLRKDIGENYRYGRKKEYMQCEQFFSLSGGNDLKKLERKFHEARKQEYLSGRTGENTSSSLKHPYIEIYEQAQMEAMLNLSENRNLGLGLCSDHAALP